MWNCFCTIRPQACGEERHRSTWFRVWAGSPAPRLCSSWGPGGSHGRGPLAGLPGQEMEWGTSHKISILEFVWFFFSLIDCRVPPGLPCAVEAVITSQAQLGKAGGHTYLCRICTKAPRGLTAAPEPTAGQALAALGRLRASPRPSPVPSSPPNPFYLILRPHPE